MARRRLGPVRRARRPFAGLLGPAIGDASQSLGALAFAATTSLVTGFTLAAVTDTLALFPGLLLLIPAAIGLRGNVFGPLGSRLSTAIQTGTFSWTWRTDSVLGQNVIGAMASSLVAAVGLAVIAHLVAQLPGRSSALDSAGGEPLDIFDLIVVSVFGGTVASVVVLGITLGLAVASVRFGWDLDNVTAPLVSASGDFVTLPSLVLATLLVQQGNVTRAFAAVFAVIAIAVVVVIVRSALTTTRRILLESVPVLLSAGSLSLVAGVVLERSIGRFLTYSVLLILLPGYLAAAGALGGILSSRLSTKVHLGLIQAARFPRGGARSDIRITFTLALPIFILLATLAGTVGATGERTSPGLGLLILVAVSGGLVATTFVAAIAYYGTLLVVRFGLDPDNHGIPMVSASLDVVGSLTLVGALLLWGVA